MSYVVPDCPECGSDSTVATSGSAELFRCRDCGEYFDEGDAGGRERSSLRRQRDRKSEVDE